MKGYQAKDVQRICDVKRSRLQVWDNAGWTPPSIEKASGKGTRNIYSLEDLFAVMFFKTALEVVRQPREIVAEYCAATMVLIKEEHGGLHDFFKEEHKKGHVYACFGALALLDQDGEPVPTFGIASTSESRVITGDEIYVVAINLTRIYAELMTRID